MNSRTSRSLQGVSPYTFPLRTADHFLRGSVFTSTEPSDLDAACLPLLREARVEPARVPLAGLSLPHIQFLIDQGILISGNVHLHGRTSQHANSDELDVDSEENVRPLEDYARWTRVDASFVYGSGVARPAIDPSDEEY